MNNAVPVHGQVLAYSPKQIELIRRTLASDCNTAEFDLFMEIARNTGLSPLKKHIYAVIYSKDKPDKRRMSIIVGIDGYRALAARNKDYRPSEDAPQIEYDPNLINNLNPAGIVSATVKCWKLGPDHQWYPVAGTAFWNEYCPLTEEWVYDKDQGKRVPTGEYTLDPKSNWFKMPRVMIAKAAESQALRRGWPEDLSGLYSEEEMERSRVEDMTASEAADTFEKQKRLELTGSKDAVFVQWSPDMPLEAVPIGQFADRAAAFANACKTLPDLIGWEDTNRVALQDFWARAKSDALELKKILEARRRQICETAMA